jgi:hypothetical protein
MAIAGVCSNESGIDSSRIRIAPPTIALQACGCQTPRDSNASSFHELTAEPAGAKMPTSRRIRRT